VRTILPLLGLALLLASPVFAAAPERAWTVMVYMAADNDLEPFALDNLKEMLAAGGGPQVNLLILADRGQAYATGGVGGLDGWKGARLLRADKGALTRLADWGDTDMGDPATLARFISWSLTECPARRTALVFWDHGGAWAGFGADESHGSLLTLDGLEKGLAAGLSAARRPGLDLVGFDACLMADFETMARLRPYAAFYLGSEEVEPGHGWDYGSLSVIASNPSAGPVELGKALIAGFMRKAAAQKTQARACLSLVDLGRLPALEKAMLGFAGAARAGIGANAPELGRGADSALAFGKAGSPGQDAHLVDIGALARAVESNDPDLKPQCDALLAALSSCVAAREAGSLLKESTGISVYFPNRRKLYSADYERWGYPGWRDLLSSYFKASAAAPADAVPIFKAKDNQGALTVEKDGLSLAGTLAPGGARNVVDAWFAYGIQEDSLTVLLGDSPAAVDTATGRVSGFWDRTLLILRQGSKETYGYLSETEAEDGQTLYSVPFAYFKDGRTGSDDYDYVYMDVTVDSDGAVVSSTLYTDSENGLSGELSPRKGSVLVPLVEVVGEDGESDMEMTEDWGFNAADWRSIELDYEEIEGGSTVYLELNAYNADDNGDWLYAEGVVK
jgi:hypothetical protein